MSTPDTSKSSIRIKVDLTNPGQFFACCGLLELAGRVEPGASGYFENGCFVMQADVDRLLAKFFDSDIEVIKCASSKARGRDDCEVEDEDDETVVDPNRGRIYPMRLPKPFDLLLDWWNDEEAQEQKLKTWTAGQRVTDLLINHHKKHKRSGETHFARIPSMREHFARAVREYPHDWIRAALPIEAPMAFSYDSRLSRNNALDLGHTDAGVLAFSPAVDVLVLIALQRFRPRMLTQWSRNVFCTWREPLPVEIASVAALGMIPHLITDCYEFPIKRRDSQGRFKLFGHAQRTRRPYV